MNKKITQFSTIAISVLIGNFIIDLIMMKTEPYLRSKSLQMTLVLRMLASVIIFYPVFTLLEVYVKNLSEAFIKSTKQLTGMGALSVVISFLVAFGIVYAGYICLIYKVKLF
ncbi:MAG: hypothetical protein SFY32_04385 [Bacteroidota bacterium]|nr:hypothetical protein [Bacteroidota bacterium]